MPSIPARFARRGSALPLALLTIACAQARPAMGLDPTRHAIRINQVGYLPASPKVAVLCSLDTAHIRQFTVETSDGRRALGPLPAVAAPAFGPCASTHRLDFSAIRGEGEYRLVAAGVRSPL